MKQLMKQLGKCVCYVLLFWGMQQIVGTIVGFWYGFREGMRAAVAGTIPDAEELALGVAEYITQNTSWIVGVSGILTLLFLWIFFKVRKKKLLQECRLQSFEAGRVVPVVLLGMSSAAVVSILLQILPIPEAVMEAYAQSSSAMIGGAVPATILATVIIAPVTEEVIFRGFILSRLREAMPVWAAVGISSFLFALLHGNLLWMVYAFVLGCLLSVVALRLKSIGASLVLHVAFNATGVLMGFLPVTGGALYLIGIFALVVAIAMFLLTFYKKAGDVDGKEMQEEFV